MLRRITLDNFMSHAHTVIELSPGLTVLVGPNNCGKSAVVAALQAVCGDTAGSYMVRHGERVCSVTVETDDGHTIIWRRKGGSVGYVIDGREFSRAGRGNLPDDLHELLRLPQVQPAQGGEGFDVHFGLQKSPIFLIDSESKAATFFSTSSDAERLLEIQKLHKQKVVAARNEHRATAADIERFDTQLQTLAPLDDVRTELLAAEREYAEIQEQSQRIDALELLVTRIDQSQRKLDHLQSWASALGELRPPPVLAEEPPLEQIIGRLESTQRDCLRLHAVRTALSELQAPPQMADTTPLAEALARTVRAIQSLAYWSGRSQAASELRDPPQLADDASLASLCREIESRVRGLMQLQSQLQVLSSLAEPPQPQDTLPLGQCVLRLERAIAMASVAALRERALANLAEPPALDDPAPLADLIRRYTVATKARGDLIIQINSIDMQIKAVDEQISGWLADNPICPLCGGPTRREHVLAGGHEHE